MDERIVILGAKGQLGLALWHRLEKEGRGHLALGPAELDLKSPQVAARIRDLKPTVCDRWRAANVAGSGFGNLGGQAHTLLQVITDE